MKELPNIWLVVGFNAEKEIERAIFSASYSKSGLTVTVRRQHSGEICGKAQGGGYDKTSTALAHALTKVYGIPLTDGGWGESSVFAHALKHGVKVRRLSDALYVLGVNG